MPHSLLVAVSHDNPFVAALAERLGSAWTVRQHASLLGAELDSRTFPSAWIADFRVVAAGGHAEARLVEKLVSRHPRARIVALLPALCPEPLERTVAAASIEALREPHSVDQVVRLVSQSARLEDQGMLAADAMALSATPESVDGAAGECDYALAGLTRRFETSTPRLKMMLADLEVAARHDVTVLLIGETGSGKTYLSRLIHEISPRRSEPFLPVACGALPADLIESELFGHVKGAFTSAHADKEGKFIAAGCGTILLDEIDVLGPEQQVKLLRVIESGEFEPVGSNRTQTSAARLIVASNLDLLPLVEQRRFRADLYYRLNMLKFEIPPLRSRRPDIVPLAKKFISEHSARHGVEIRMVDESLYSGLMRYPWPGNVRELEHVIQRAVIYCRDGVLSARQLPSHVLVGEARPGNDGQLIEAATPGSLAGRSLLGRHVALSEREIIEETLFQNNQSRTNTARALGISRVTLYNKMKKYGMTRALGAGLPDGL